MNIYWREIKAHRKSLIIWSIGIIFMVASGMSKYTSLYSSGHSMEKLMADMPKSMQVIMGAGSFDLSLATGYYGVLYLYLLVMATIHAVMIGANIIAKEERDKTSEFLFVKPVSRKQIITSKLAAAFSNIVVFNLVTLISSILIVSKFSKGEEDVTNEISILMTGMFFLQLLFMMIGSGIAALMKNPKRAASLSTGILLITFILSIAIDLNEKLESLKFFTPFKYFEAKNIMYGGDLDVKFVLITVTLIFSLLVMTFVFFQKRDLKI